MNDMFMRMLEGTTERRQTVIKYEPSDKCQGFEVQIIREGRPSEDMAGVEVTRRAVAVVVRPIDRSDVEVHLTCDQAADIADALDQAAVTLRDEEK